MCNVQCNMQLKNAYDMISILHDKLTLDFTFLNYSVAPFCNRRSSTSELSEMEGRNWNISRDIVFSSPGAFSAENGIQNYVHG